MTTMITVHPFTADPMCCGLPENDAVHRPERVPLFVLDSVGISASLPGGEEQPKARLTWGQVAELRAGRSIAQPAGAPSISAGAAGLTARMAGEDEPEARLPWAEVDRIQQILAER